MRAEFRRVHPAVTALAGTAEAVPLPDGSVDAVLVGQAMHWFDMDKAFPELERVLRAGGVLAGLWNADDDRVDWVRGLWAVSGNPSLRHGSHGEHIERPRHPAFSPFEDREFAHSQRRTAESMTATVSTQSQMLMLEDAARAELLDRVLAFLRATPETSGAEFDLPIRTLVGRSVRMG
ncbi:type 11 methyltransferase [Kutzneria sp. CA-103260]|nr:type 11 methyltransferase [Kutzneria sp. CA-103260]